MRVAHTEKFHFRFLAAERYGVYSFPVEAIHLFEPVHESPGHEAITLIFIALISNSCGCIQHITVVYDLSFEIPDLSAYHFAKMQSSLELGLYSKIFEVIRPVLHDVFPEHEESLQTVRIAVSYTHLTLPTSDLV